MFLASFQKIYSESVRYGFQKSHTKWRHTKWRGMKLNHVLLANEEPHDLTFYSGLKSVYHRQDRKGNSGDLAEWPSFLCFVWDFLLPISLTLLTKSGLGVHLCFMCDLTRKYFKAGGKSSLYKQVCRSLSLPQSSHPWDPGWGMPY